MKYGLMFDVGGTEIKAGTALINKLQKKVEIGSIRHFSARSGEPAEAIVKNFGEIAAAMLRAVPPEIPGKYADVSAEVAAVGMAFPGPFDYEHGISRMRGLNKYEAIYGMDLAAGIRRWCPALSLTVPFFFLHDVEAFALGECYAGVARDAAKVMHLCIGTGAGSAFTEAGKVKKKPMGIIPENGWIYDQPFLQGTIDDYISVRGLEKRAAQICGESLSGYELYQRCRAGEKKALQTYDQFGCDLKDALTPFLREFQPEMLVLGGQISKSFLFFGTKLKEYCLSNGIAIKISQDTSRSILNGLGYHAVYGRKETGGEMRWKDGN